MLSLFVITWIGVIAAQASPGPNLAAVASVGLSQGRRPALWVVAGIASGMLVWSAATALGLGALIAAAPFSLITLKIAGGAYLLYLGLRAARAALNGANTATFAPDRRNDDAGSAFRRGVLVVLGNPKAGLMWAAVASFLFGQGLGAGHVLAFGPLGALSGFTIYGSYALLFSTGAAMRGYARCARQVEGVFAAAFGVMGISLLWSGMRDALR